MKYPGAGRGLLPYKRLMGMCCWMGSHFTTGLTIKLHILPKVTKMGSIMSPPPPPQCATNTDSRLAGKQSKHCRRMLQQIPYP